MHLLPRINVMLDFICIEPVGMRARITEKA